MGITVVSSRFTGQDYADDADDAVLFTDCPSKWPPILSSFAPVAQLREAVEAAASGR